MGLSDRKIRGSLGLVSTILKAPLSDRWMQPLLPSGASGWAVEQKRYLTFLSENSILNVSIFASLDKSGQGEAVSVPPISHSVYQSLVRSLECVTSDEHP